MKLIRDNPIDPEELENAQRLAAGLHAITQPHATMPLTNTPDPGRRIEADRIGLPQSVIPKESADVERRREAAELEQSRQAAHDAAVESARLRGRLEGLRESERS